MHLKMLISLLILIHFGGGHTSLKIQIYFVIYNLCNFVWRLKTLGISPIFFHSRKIGSEIIHFSLKKNNKVCEHNTMIYHLVQRYQGHFQICVIGRKRQKGCLVKSKKLKIKNRYFLCFKMKLLTRLCGCSLKS